jgi:hypothetical protein
MYSDRLAIAVKTNGKVLREFEDTVFIPFGTEYSILIKNLNTVRCSVKLSIDGEDTADGNSFIVPANGSIEIERFLTSGNLKQGNRFKFIERTDRVAEHRGGNRVDDGLIRIEYEFEREPPKMTTWPPSNGNMIWTVTSGYTNGDPNALRSRSFVGGPSAVYSANASYNLGGNAGGRGTGGRDSSARSMSKGGETLCSSGNISNYASAAANDTGVTTKGSVSNQQFVEAAHLFSDGIKHAMVVRLRGLIDAVAVAKPVTVQQKPKCTGCGKINKATAKFCNECGTSLHII